MGEFERIRDDFNRRAAAAREDGLAVECGMVYRPGDLGPGRPAATPVCAVAEYPPEDGETHSSFELDGARYRVTSRGYFYRDGRRISAEEFRSAERARFSRVAATIAADIEQEEESMAASNRNAIEVEGVRWERDFAGGRYYRDGEECSRAEFEEAVGVRRSGSGGRRRSRDVAYERGGVTLTARQLEFVRAMARDEMGSPEDGWWTDSLIDCAGISPMSGGAMVSTLREKGLVAVSADGREEGGRAVRAKRLSLTDLGREVLGELLGLQAV